ncbi:hypothetical protein F4778DRAFT_453760 [Xylariomycetidae sp. FL2044]|nr:hypothetical protein F4778DRAFT_453760 [Xylariomycetidae sp. FL2044]
MASVLGRPKRQQQQQQASPAAAGSPPPPPRPPRTPLGMPTGTDDDPRPPLDNGGGIRNNNNNNNNNKRASGPFEFRGFDFFANRDFNDLKNASKAYFAPLASNASTAEKSLHGRGGGSVGGDPASWLGDASPPPSPTLRGVSLHNPGYGHRFSVSAGGFGAGGGAQKPAAQKSERICGLRRSRFWILVAATGMLLLVVIAVGVGVGVGTSKSHGVSGDSEADSTGSPAQTVTITTDVPTTTEPSSTTRTTSSSAAEATSTESTGAKLDCPAANGTQYNVPGSEKTFLRLCGIDYSGDGEATDLRQVPTESMLDCMKNCAGTADCTGCGWGYLEGDTGSQHACWLKTDLQTPHDADGDWAFSVLLS